MALAWTAAAFIAGAVAAATLGAAAWPLALALAALLAALALWRQHRSVAVWAGVLPLIFLAGLLRFELVDRGVAGDDVSHLVGGPEMRARGVIRDDPVMSDASQRFVVDVREVRRAGAWARASGGAQITTGVLPRYSGGDIVVLEGEFEAPPTDASFDYAEYLAQRGIRTILDFPEVSVIGHENGNLLDETLDSVRERLARGIEQSLPEPQASLAEGVLLGRKSALPPDLRDDLNATNTSHLVVVSGANVVLVSAFAVAALSWVFGRRRALMLSIAVVLMYMLLVGVSPPVVRGTIMGILLIIAQVTGRRTNGLVSILFAAALMIAVEPDAVRDVSFQLSFAATAGIVFVAAPLHDWIIEAVARVSRRDAVPHAVSAFVVLPLATTIAAIVATEPLIALNFERVSLVAIPANLLVVPAFPLILASSGLAAAGEMLPFGHTLLAAPGFYLLSYWIGVAGWLAGLPAASVTFDGYTSWWALTTYSALTAIGYATLRRFGRPAGGRLSPGLSWRRVAPFAAAAVPAAVLVATAGFVLRADEPARLRVTVLAVGQGDAILIQTPSGEDILVDGGPGPAILRELGDELASYDRSIELVVLTHPQLDHVAGLIDVLNRYDVRRVMVGPGLSESAGYDAWLDAVAVEHVIAEHPGSGTTFDLGDGVRLEVLGPTPALSDDYQLNNTSLVVRLVLGDVSFLLTGDIEASAERELIASGADLSATVLKVPHHGSATSSSPEFLAAVDPDVSVVSAGEGNRFGHPAADVAARLEAYGDLYVTAIHGAVRFETDGRRLWVSTNE
jgi:competence protein ComEC